MSDTLVPINRVIPGLLEIANPSREGLTKPEDKSSGNFTELLSNLVKNVNEVQHESSELQQAFLNGEPVELHQVMVKAEEAGLAMELLLEIRNKLVNAYSDLIRMPL